MNSFLVQIKNFLQRQKQGVSSASQDVQAGKEIMSKRHADITKSIREFNKFQIQKNFWRGLFNSK